MSHITRLEDVLDDERDKGFRGVYKVVCRFNLTLSYGEIILKGNVYTVKRHKSYSDAVSIEGYQSSTWAFYFELYDDFIINL